MSKGRLEAFSDGVIAIIITIMVLELKIPHGADWESLRPILPVFLGYVLSFIYIGIYWNNHHHLLQATDRVNGRILWANLHLLFWLSLVPAATAWTSEHHAAPLPNAVYGGILLAAGGAYKILQTSIGRRPELGSKVKAAVGSDFKGNASLVLYLAAIPLAYVSTWIADAIYVLVAMMWLVPDSRIERTLAGPRR